MAQNNNNGKRKYSVSRIEKKNTLDQLRKYCQKKKIPYIGLTKRKVAENITAYLNKEEPPNPIKTANWEDSKHIDRELTPQIKHFCLLYALDTTGKKQEEWAKDFNVNKATIHKWLQWDQVKELVDQYVNEREKRIMLLFEKYEEVALLELIKIIQSPKPTEVKRKSINDFLGFAGRKNVNTAKVIVSQNQAQAQKSSMTAKTDEELDAELAELSNLLEEGE